MPGPFQEMTPEDEAAFNEKLDTANQKLAQALDPERAKVRQHLISEGVIPPDNRKLWEDEDGLSSMEKVILGWLTGGKL